MSRIDSGECFHEINNEDNQPTDISGTVDRIAPRIEAQSFILIEALNLDLNKAHY